MNREQIEAWLAIEGWEPYYYCNHTAFDNVQRSRENNMCGYWRAPHYHYVISKENDRKVMHWSGADHEWRDAVSCDTAYFTHEFCILPEYLDKIYASILAQQEAEK